MLFVSQGHFFDFFRFEVNFQEGLNCGGAYIKLLSADNDLELVQTDHCGAGSGDITLPF